MTGERSIAFDFTLSERVLTRRITTINMSSYYDLNSILTDSQKVPCTFELAVPGLGYLSGNPGTSITQNTKVELPLWLGEMLAVNRLSNSADTLITMDMPAALNKRVMNALKADAKSVDLRAQAMHFYGLGARMLELFEDEEVVVEILMETFKKRSQEVADKASGSRNLAGEGGEFVRGLEEQERALFRAAHDGQANVRKWFESAGRD